MKRTAVITGATSGIGAAFAKKLASMGYDLLLTGRRKEIIKALAGELSRRYRVEVNVILAELSDPKDRKKVADAVKRLDGIEYLVNNAGFGINSSFFESALADEEAMVAVHVLAPMELIRAAAPAMLKNRKGNIVTLSSVGGFTPLSGAATYCATKAFVTLFTESLHMEMKGKGIRFQSLCPGFTRTDFHARLNMEERAWQRLQRFYWMQPDEVVEYSLKCLRKGRVVCVPGFPNKLLVKLAGIIPRSLYYRLSTDI
jgi:hypothetical protein